MKREPDENFKEYKAKQKDKNNNLKRYLKGRVIWNRGTYIQKDEIAKTILSPFFKQVKPGRIL